MTRRVLFRARSIGPLAAVVPVAIGLAIFLIAMIVLLDALAWRIAAVAGIVTVMAGLAWISRRRKLVMELALEGEHLLVRTLFQPGTAAPLRIAISATEDWQEFVDTVGTGATESTNRYVALRHKGVTFAVPVDHAIDIPE